MLLFLVPVGMFGPPVLAACTGQDAFYLLWFVFVGALLATPSRA